MKSNTTRSKAMKLAHAIRKQNKFLTWGQCQAQAWKVIKLKAALKTGVVEFVYQKQNGELRAAKGTLSPELFSYKSKSSGKPSPLTIVKYFDCDKNAFRSFRAERILSIAA